MKMTFLCKCGNPLDVWRIRRDGSKDYDEEEPLGCDTFVQLMPCEHCMASSNWELKAALDALVAAAKDGRLTEFVEKVNAAKEGGAHD